MVTSLEIQSGRKENRPMDTINEPPIFCDNCPTLALAELDAAPLCDACLLEAVRSSDDDRIADKIAPLQFRHARIISGMSDSFDSGRAVQRLE
jgi:hypothetical protein